VLRQIREELRVHHPAQALDLLDRNAALLRSGPLVEEVEVARISALCEMGRDGDARVAIDRFGTSWPGSPLVVVFRDGCAGVRKAP
jgi:hypothetical protein